MIELPPELENCYVDISYTPLHDRTHAPRWFAVVKYQDSSCFASGNTLDETLTRLAYAYVSLLQRTA